MHSWHGETGIRKVVFTGDLRVHEAAGAVLAPHPIQDLIYITVIQLFSLNRVLYDAIIRHLHDVSE